MRGFPEEKWTESSACAEVEGAAAGGREAAGLPAVAMAGGERRRATGDGEDEISEGIFEIGRAHV